MVSTMTVIKSLRIISIQLPFIPIIRDMNFFSLEEPDGGIGASILGQEINGITKLSSFPIHKNYKKKILAKFSQEYLDWMLRLTDEILESIIRLKSPDIILFPEYFFPAEQNVEFEKILKNHSRGRCIVGGVGSVQNKSEDMKKNRFIVANEGNLQYGEKIQPNQEEKRLGIIGGEGPLIFPMTFTRDGAKERTYIEVLMCSDFIDYGPNRKISNIESSQNIPESDVSVVLIPSFSTKVEDFQKAESQCLRRHQIIAFSNCSFYGHSTIWYPPLSKSAQPQKELKAFESGYIFIDLPLDFPGSYLSTPVGKSQSNLNPEIELGYIQFKRESDNREPIIKLDSLSFYYSLSKRLHSAIIIAGILLKKCEYSEDELKKELIRAMDVWKRTQSLINNYIDPKYLFSEIQDDDIISYELIINEDFWNIVGNKFKAYLPTEYQKITKEIEKKKSNRKIVLPRPKSWDIN